MKVLAKTPVSPLHTAALRRKVRCGSSECVSSHWWWQCCGAVVQPMGEGKGWKIQCCCFSNLNQPVPEQPTGWGQSSAGATSVVTMVVGGPPVSWLAFPGGCSQMGCVGMGFESTLRNSNLLLPHSV